MSWTLLAAVILLLSLASGSIAVRRAGRGALRGTLAERTRARELGSDRARLLHPHVDLSRCIGCGSCVEACPEDGVLALQHGQAVVVHGARCVGHGRCAEACPVGAIALTLGDVSQRRDLPALTERFEAPRVPGLYLAGEVTGYALVRTAIAHGTAVADEVARGARSTGGALDLVVVGAGPAGLACALRARERGLSFVVLEQEHELGGTVAKYPRRKLVMTQPVELPLFGRLERTSYAKEELVELWQEVAREHDLPVRTGQEFQKVERLGGGGLRVHTKQGAHDARAVCLALGRRGTPRKLGVPGEELPKVSYSLLDAHSYQGRRILVVGGGDSAVEAALGLAEQPGNRVTISYRKTGFFRLKSRNEARVNAALASGELAARFSSEVRAIGPDSVRLEVEGGGTEELPNDEVFVFAGGTPPIEVLEASGVSFDPADRPPPVPLSERGTGLFPALFAALALALCVAGWVLAHADYYALGPAERPHHEGHARLAPSGSIGLVFGIGAATLVLANLCYLARRRPRFAWIPGSLQRWMTAHVATGICALLLALAHGAMAPRHTVGGHALWAMALLVVTGAIGRYFYAFVPRAANGRELELDELRNELAALAAEWDQAGLGQELRGEVERLVALEGWQGSFLVRVRALVASQSAFRAGLRGIVARARAADLAQDQVERLTQLARRAHRAALMSAHFEELRSILATWRWFHRWVALGLVLLVVLHVVYALRYGSLLS